MAEYDGMYARIGDESSDTTRISAYELTRFLHYFRAAYVLFATNHMPGRNESISHFELSRYEIDGARHLVEQYRKSGLPQEFPRGAVGRLAATELTPNIDDLEISQISYHSPLHVVFAGIPVALAAAVILSGGELNLIGVVKVKLPPLGTGIAKLREAFGQRNQIPRPRPISRRKKKGRADEI